jgi:hypothetical protein
VTGDLYIADVGDVLAGYLHFLAALSGGLIRLFDGSVTVSGATIQFAFRLRGVYPRFLRPNRPGGRRTGAGAAVGC